MAEILPIRRKTLFNQSINQSINRIHSCLYLTTDKFALFTGVVMGGGGCGNKSYLNTVMARAGSRNCTVEQSTRCFSPSAGVWVSCSL